MKDNVPSDTIYAICAFIIFKKEICNKMKNGEASRLYVRTSFSQCVFVTLFTCTACDSIATFKVRARGSREFNSSFDRRSLQIFANFFRKRTE